MIRERVLRAGALVLVLVVLAAAAVAGCGSSSSGSSANTNTTNTNAAPAAPEKSPPGDIPDSQAYVRYAPPGGGYAVKVPEGWSRAQSGSAVAFTDKLNTVRLESAAAGAQPTAAAVKQTTVPKLKSTEKGFALKSVSTVHRKGGTAVRISYQALGKPDAVTGKTRVDDVEQYVFFHRGRKAVVTLSGPKGADNVDPWRTVTDSLRWTR